MISTSKRVFAPKGGNAETKICSACKCSKPVSEFYLEPSGRPRSRCKVCVCAATKASDVGRYQRNPGAHNARVRRWQAKHPAQHREIVRKSVARQRRKKREAGTPPLFEFPIP